MPFALPQHCNVTINQQHFNIIASPLGPTKEHAEFSKKTTKKTNKQQKKLKSADQK